MKVILTENVKTLGNVGDIVNVSAGHARNFLIPKKLGVLADEKNKSLLDEQMKRLNKKIAAEKGAAEEIKTKLDGITVDYEKRVGMNGKLFGAITTTELSKTLEGKGIQVEKRVLQVDRPIKAVGEYEVKAKLFKDVEAEFKVKVVIDPKQAEELKKKQAENAKKKAKEAEAKANEAQAEEAESTETTDVE